MVLVIEGIRLNKHVIQQFEVRIVRCGLESRQTPTRYQFDGHLNEHLQT
jgi:hypothetical protein